MVQDGQPLHPPDQKVAEHYDTRSGRTDMQECGLRPAILSFAAEGRNGEPQKEHRVVRCNGRINQCKPQIKSLNTCLVREASRLRQKEEELRVMVEEGRMPDSIMLKAKEMAEETRQAEVLLAKEMEKKGDEIESYI